MKAQKVAAQFAAAAWYEEVRQGRQDPAETARFAAENWQAFQGIVPAGLGRLLLRIGQAEPQGEQGRRRRSSVAGAR